MAVTSMMTCKIALLGCHTKTLNRSRSTCAQCKKIEARNTHEPSVVGSKGRLKGSGGVQGAKPPEALVFFNAGTAFSMQTYIHKMVKFKTLLQTKIRQSMFVERFLLAFGQTIYPLAHVLGFFLGQNDTHVYRFFV